MTSTAAAPQLDWLEMIPPDLATSYRYINRCIRVNPEETGGFPRYRLLERQALVPLIDSFAASYPDCAQAAIVSMWLQVYLERLVPPVFTASYFLDLSVPVELDAVRVFFSADGCPSHWCVPARGPEARGDPFERFGSLVRGHLVPLIDALSAHTGTTRRLLWSNAGACFAAGANALAEFEFPVGDATRGADKLLLASDWPDGWRNPLSRTVRFSPHGSGRISRRHRVCCLRYELPDMSLCDDCPKPAGLKR